MGKLKLTNQEFWAILRENAGLFARTSRAIAKQYEKQGITMTRQAIEQRAKTSPDLLQDIQEMNIDIAEEGIHSLLRSQDERIKLEAAKFYLKTKGKNRGYIEKTEQDITSGGEKISFSPHEVKNMKPDEVDGALQNELSK